MFYSMEYYGIVLTKFIIGFIIVITHLNFSGKTQLSQMTPVDFIGNFVLGGIIGGVIYSDTVPMYQYIVVLLIGVTLISSLNWISKHIYFFRSVAIGDPIPVIKNGRFLMENILKRKNKIDIINISSQVHSQGVQSFQQIKFAQIEPGGQLTVICDEKKMPSVIVMKDGKMRVYELASIDKDENWVKQQMAELDVSRQEVFIAEFWNGNLYFVLSDGKVRCKMM